MSDPPPSPSARPLAEGTVPPAAGPAAPPSLEAPELYLNRELAHLEFNRRVLQQARDESTPLLERLRFLTISSTNLDEFFEIRVAGLREQIDLTVGPGVDGRTAAQALREISLAAHELVAEQYRVLREDLLPALDRQGLRILFREVWSEETRRWVRRYFLDDVLPVLTPVGLDPAHPFPMILNKSLNFVVSLRGKDAFGRSSRLAVVQAPRLLPRLIPLPGEAPARHVTLSSVIREFVGELFPGMEVQGCFPFRVTRNSDLWVDYEEVDDLLRALKGELPSRNYGQAVRLEVSNTAPEDIVRFLQRQFDLDEDSLYRVDGPVNLHRLSTLCDADRPDLKYQPHVPALPARWVSGDNPFDAIRRGDVLLHLPFQSFKPVVELLEWAARDRDVLAIKLTLYRTGGDSPLVDALVEASRAGKEVTAVIELRARFDEADNIASATRLQEAGAKVVYGIVGYKAHAKMMLIVRREQGRMRRYVHLSTGNYHPRTARLYTDLSLMSADPELGEDVHSLFQQLTGLGRVGALNKLVQSPFGLHRRMLECIEAEAEAARRGEPALIQAKMNSLTETEVVRALYRASQAGVPIDLLVRGPCSLRPGVPGVSETIRVRSIVGRFLEHARVFHFHAGGRRLVYCASADWMPRNFFHRVEAAFPIEDEALRQRVLDEALDAYLRDNVQAWELQPDGHYRRLSPDGDPPFCAQSELLARLSGAG